MFNVNYKTVTVSLISVFIGSQAFAQAVRVKEKAPAVKEQIIIKNSAAARTGEANVADITKAAADARTAAVSGKLECSREDFASQLIKDTKISYADALALIEAGHIRMGTCNANEGGLLSYNPQARENLLSAGLLVMKQMNNVAFNKLSAAQKATVDAVWASALQQVLGNGTTQERAVEVASKIQKECNLRPMVN